MGCSNSREKLENEMIKLKFQRVQIQMERKNQIKILEGLEKKKITEPVIPDFISLKPERPIKKILTDTKNEKNKKKENKNKKDKKDKANIKDKKDKNDIKKRSKSENAKSKKSESTGPESKKDGKTKITKKEK